MVHHCHCFIISWKALYGVISRLGRTCTHEQRCQPKNKSQRWQFRTNSGSDRRTAHKLFAVLRWTEGTAHILTTVPRSIRAAVATSSRHKRLSFIRQRGFTQPETFSWRRCHASVILRSLLSRSNQSPNRSAENHETLILYLLSLIFVSVSVFIFTLHHAD